MTDACQVDLQTCQGREKDRKFILTISWDIFAITGWMDGLFLNKHAIGGLNNIMSVYRTNAMVLIWPN